MRVAVAGATGFIGAVLAEALMEDGHDVTALTRRPDDYTGAGRAVQADIGDAQSLRRALDGQEAAYYLVHSLAVEDFAVRDRKRCGRLRRRGEGCRAEPGGLPRRSW